MLRAIVSDITGFSTHDGPGIRTTVFIKGCPLRCAWCSNPETWASEPMLYYHAARCSGCRSCEIACPQHAIRPPSTEGDRIDRGACNLCLACVSTCPQDAFALSGIDMTVDELFRRIERDKPFYGKHGGVTVSGGEPLSAPSFVAELFARCKAEGISTVLDTSGYGTEHSLAAVLGSTDLALLDIKHMDPSEHERWTGVSNETILRNARTIMSSVKTRVSIPLVPGVNDDLENLNATAEFVKRGQVEWIDINPFHALGEAKYRYLGKTPPYEAFRPPLPDEIKRACAIMAQHGLKTTVGRMM